MLWDQGDDAGEELLGPIIVVFPLRVEFRQSVSPVLWEGEEFLGSPAVWALGFSPGELGEDVSDVLPLEGRQWVRRLVGVGLLARVVPRFSWLVLVAKRACWFPHEGQG